MKWRPSFKTLIQWHIFWTTFCWRIIDFAYFCCLCCLVRDIIFVILTLRFFIYFLYYSVLLLISYYVIICIERFRLFNKLFSRPRLPDLFVSSGRYFSFQNKFVSYHPSGLWLSYFLNSSYTTSSRLTCSSLTSLTYMLFFSSTIWTDRSFLVSWSVMIISLRCAYFFCISL